VPAETLSFAAADGRRLGGALILPAQPALGAVLIAGANGVPHRFYAGTAEALAAAGYATLRFDYRGLATSRVVAPRRESATMRDWGALDVAAALETLAARAPGLPLHLLGHSAGGWLPGLAANAGRLDSIVTVASQSGYWRLWPWPERVVIATFWYALLPAAAAVCGYLPRVVLGGGESLPPGVAREWARWGRSPAFLQSDATPGFAAFRGRLLALAVEGDDLYAPYAAVERFATFYGAAATREVRAFAPRGPRGDKAKHFTVFSARFREALIGTVAEHFGR
jgi:predicted alpha/beta hydrolase